MEKAERRIIADRIKVARKKCGYTQEKAAEALGVTHNSYIKIENAYHKPSLELLIKMSHVYDVSIDVILTGESKSVSIDEERHAKLSETLSIIEPGAFDRAIEFLMISKKLLAKQPIEADDDAQTVDRV